MAFAGRFNMNTHTAVKELFSYAIFFNQCCGVLQAEIAMREDGNPGMTDEEVCFHFINITILGELKAKFML